MNYQSDINQRLNDSEPLVIRLAVNGLYQNYPAICQICFRRITLG